MSRHDGNLGVGAHARPSYHGQGIISGIPGRHQCHGGVHSSNGGHASRMCHRLQCTLRLHGQVRSRSTHIAPGMGRSGGAGVNLDDMVNTLLARPLRSWRAQTVQLLSCWEGGSMATLRVGARAA